MQLSSSLGPSLMPYLDQSCHSASTSANGQSITPSSSGHGLSRREAAAEIRVLTFQWAEVK